MVTVQLYTSFVLYCIATWRQSGLGIVNQSQNSWMSSLTNHRLQNLLRALTPQVTYRALGSRRSQKYDSHSMAYKINKTYLLWRNIKSLSPHINLLVNVDTRNDEKHTWTSGPAWQQAPKTKNNRPLILLMWNSIRSCTALATCHTCTTLITMNRESGSDTAMIRRDIAVSRCAKIPGPSSHTRREEL